MDEYYNSIDEMLDAEGFDATCYGCEFHSYDKQTGYSDCTCPTKLTYMCARLKTYE